MTEEKSKKPRQNLARTFEKIGKLAGQIFDKGGVSWPGALEKAEHEVLHPINQPNNKQTPAPQA